jgi:predicted DNA-binding protein
MRRKKMKDERLHIRISSELKDQLKKLAEKDHRTVADYVKNMIKIEIEKESK